MRSKLARTLLILGSVGACERAEPVVDSRARPAVGNIGQAGRPAPEAPRLVTPVPAAIAPPPVAAAVVVPARTVRRTQRVQRAVTRAPVIVETVPLSVQVSVEKQQETTPLRDRRERPAHANMGRRSAMDLAEDAP